MIPAAFEYERATSIDHAIELLGREEAKIIAGGHSLIPAMRLRLARPELLVDLGGLDDLRYVREANGGLAIGAMTRHSELLKNELVRGNCAVLTEATALVADPQVRHRGTLGGALCHCDPASDQASVLMALGATFVARGPEGERTISCEDFFVGWFESALGPQEVMTEVRVPGGSAGAYEKFSRRAHDWATVGVAAVRVDGSVRVALTSMGPVPVRARGVEEALAGGASAADAAARAAEGTSPASDMSGSAEYREELARVLTRRALERLG